MNHALNLIKKWLVTFMMSMPLAGFTAESDKLYAIKKKNYERRERCVIEERTRKHSGTKQKG